MLGATVTVASLFATGSAQAPVAGRSDVSARADAARFSSCAELQDWYERGRAEQRRLQPVPYAVPATAERAAGPASTGDAVGSGATGTNLQEPGVDEADVAKTDGRLAVVVHGRRLRTWDVTAAVPRLLAELSLGPVQASELVLVGDRAVVVSRGPSWLITKAVPQDRRSGPAPRFAPPRSVAQSTTITTVDLASPERPAVVSTQTVDGTALSAGERSGTVRIALRDEPWQRTDVFTPNREDSTGTRLETAEQWIPSIRDGAAAPRPLMPCTEVRHPRVRSGSGTTAVLTLDPDHPEELRSVALAASGSVAYSAADRLYVASTDPRWQGGLGRATTHLHAFDLGPERTDYLGSGTVPGVVRDRWALSEYEGRLRVASTLQDDVETATTQVSVLQERGGDLVTVGSVGGIGPGEDVEAVRWFGDRAVVVTFRRTDPLHTLDLSDPAHPVVVGELRLPGFSSYLHPVGGGFVLGVGQDATGDGQTAGAQVSTFDLASPSMPRRVAALALGGDSPVGADARAFCYLPAQRLALVPVRHGGRAFFAVVRVGTDGALTRLEDVALSGRASTGARVLPLGHGRVAVVDFGAVRQVLDLSSSPSVTTVPW